MKIQFYAPSYKRPQRSTTQIVFPVVTLVVMKSEAAAYRANGNEVIECPDAAQGNLCRVRNWIIDNLIRDNDAIVILDDDIMAINRWYNGQKIGLNSETLDAEMARLAQMCKDAGLYFFGINSTDSKIAYREGTPFNFNAYIGGPLQGHMKGTELRYDEKLPLKEDYDMTLQHLQKYRGCLRANFLFYDVKQAEQVGGCATYRNVEREEQQFRALQRKWGSRIIQQDLKSKRSFDFNPILRSPIRGV